MYTLSVHGPRGIEFFSHDTWDECYEHMEKLGTWRYVCCFGTGICEFEQGDLVARIYRS